MGKAMGQPRPHARSAPRSRSEGFTLLEVVIAGAVTSILLLGIGSAMLLASRAIPEAHSPTADSLAGAEALERIATELQYAITLNQRSGQMIEFTVADRNGDKTPEVIRYEWSGTEGDPLTRQYNGGTAMGVLSNVHAFVLSYDRQTISTQTLQSNESAETLLIGYDSSSNYHDYTIQNTELYSEYIRPVLPANAIGWKVTRVRFYAGQSGFLDGVAAVQLQTPTAGGLPSGVVLGEETFQESLLPLVYLVREMTYTQVCNLSPQQGLCIVFCWRSGGESCKLLGQDQQVTAPNQALLKSTDQTATWSLQPNASLLFSVYGTVTAAGTPQIQNTYYVNAVTIRLKAGTDDQATVQTSIRVLNRPQVTE